MLLLFCLLQAILAKTMDEESLDMDLNFVATYDPKFGIKVLHVLILKINDHIRV